MKINLQTKPMFLSDFRAVARRICGAGLASVGPTCRSAWTRGSASLPGFRAQGVIRVLSILAACLFGLLLPAQAHDPWITNTNYPMDTNVNVEATVSFRLYATSTNVPVTYQWRHEGSNLLGATNVTLLLTNLTVAHAGGYTAWITNKIGGFTNSRTAMLTVDPTFTKVMKAGALLTDTAGGWNGCWVDYDGDGNLDVSVAPTGLSLEQTRLYHNEGNGTFRKVTTNAIAQAMVQSFSHVWVDYDNDDKLDLFVPNDGRFNSADGRMNDMLFRNLGNGAFTRITTGDPVIDRTQSGASVWSDYNRDGFLDLFVTAGGGGDSQNDRIESNDILYRGNGDGTFRKMTAAEVGPIVSDLCAGDIAVWADVDNDGLPELSRNVCKVPANWPNWIWTNEVWHLDNQGKFYLMDFGDMKMGGVGYSAISWADYDNDGFLDALVWAEQGLLGLYRNLAGQGFTNVAATAFPNLPANGGAVWADYDNDGWQDLFVWSSGTPPSALYRNNGDGTFTSKNIGGLTSAEIVPNWGDYNNDGFLDALVVYGPGTPNSLFRNNGNGNHWLKVKLDGRASNRSGIGAKVRVNATIGGTNFWQMREISGQGIGLDNGLIAHFGLGDATNVTTLRIEWPSGIVQELPNVAPNQFLTVVESQAYSSTNPPPSFTGATKDASGSQLSFTEPAIGARYLLEASTNLVTWTKLLARTSIGVTNNYTDTRATNYPSRFYRLQVP